MEPTQSRHKQAAQSTGIVYIATRCTRTVPSIYFGTGTQHVKEKNSLMHTETENGIRHYFRLGRKMFYCRGSILCHPTFSHYIVLGGLWWNTQVTDECRQTAQIQTWLCGNRTCYRQMTGSIVSLSIPQICSVFKVIISARCSFYRLVCLVYGCYILCCLMTVMSRTLPHKPFYWAWTMTSHVPRSYYILIVVIVLLSRVCTLCVTDCWAIDLFWVWK